MLSPGRLGGRGQDSVLGVENYQGEKSAAWLPGRLLSCQVVTTRSCPPLPGAGGRRGRGPREEEHEECGAYVVVLEGVEKVPSELTVVPRGSWRIANATYVVRRILWREQRQLSLGVPNSLPYRQGHCQEQTLGVHLLLEVHLCRLTLEGKKNPVQFLARSSLRDL